MTDNAIAKVHWSFWLITVLVLIWNTLGAINFIVQLNPEMVSAYRESEQSLIRGRPIWATIGFAVAVFGGTLGCVLLLLRKHSSIYFFVASFFGVLIATAQSLTADVTFGVAEVVGIVLMPVAIAIFLIWYSKYAIKRGWLGTT